MNTDELLEAYRRMATIRHFEAEVATLYRNGEIPGFVHISIGQEAAAVGVCWPLEPSDVITSTHRGHGHCIAKGVDVEGMFAELMARDTGTCRGRGGSMHIADPDFGMFGANGIVGAGLPIAVGAAFAVRRSGGVVVGFFGDGAVAQGFFHEALNLATAWKLPVAFVCENNGYAEFSSAQSQPATLSQRAAGYGLDYFEVDGNDVEAVSELMERVVSGLRAGGGPVVVEAMTYRIHGHYEGDPQKYRTNEEVQGWTARDPLELAGARLAERGVDRAKVEALDGDVAAAVAAARDRARTAPEPAESSLHHFVIVERQPTSEPALPETTEVIRTMDAIKLAFEHELESDPDVFLAGIDVGAGGNVFALTRGLAERWPDRVLDTPISESAIAGLAVGASLAGMRPVVEIMYVDFIGACFDQLLNQAAKLRYMTAGKLSLPLTIRTQFGAGRASGSQHSQSLEALLAHIPGLTVVMPCGPAETYGLLRAAIRDPNPVIFIENRLQYTEKGPKPPPGYILPIGAARTVRAGDDITVVTYSRMVHEAMAAAEELAAEGVGVEVIDLRSIVPLDRAAIAASVEKTGRLVIAHEATTDFGVGAEIGAMAAGELFWHLDAPVQRVGAPPVPPPYAPTLERVWLPDRRRIAQAVRRTVRT